MKDETKANQDTSLNGDSSEKAGGSTSQQPRTFTEKEVQEAVRKAASDALAKAGRDAKALEQKAADLAKREEAHAKWQREQDEKEEESARGDDSKLSDLQRKRKAREEQDRIKADREALERDRAEHAAELAEAKEAKQEILIWNVASKFKLDAAALKEKCAKLGLTTEAQINDFAQEISTGKKEENNLHIDSNETRGGGGALTKERAEKMTMEEYAAERKKMEPKTFH